MSNPLIANNILNIPVAGGNVQVNVNTGSVTLVALSGQQQSTNLSDPLPNLTVTQTVVGPSGSLTDLATTVTITDTTVNGAAGYTISTGLATVNLGVSYGDGVQVDSINMAAGGLYSGVEDASVTIDANRVGVTNSWNGTVTGETSTSSTTLDSLSYSSALFNATSQNPCDVIGAGFTAICGQMIGNPAAGALTVQENYDLLDPVYVTASSTANDTLLANQDSAGISFDDSYDFGSGSGSGTDGGSAASTRLAVAATGASKNEAGITSTLAGKISPESAASSSTYASLIGKITSLLPAQKYYGVSSLSGETLIGAAGAVITFGTGLDGTALSFTSNKAGQEYAHFNSSGVVTSYALGGTGEVLNLSNFEPATLKGITIASGASATVNGSTDFVAMDANSTLSITGNVGVGSVDEVFATTGDTVHSASALISGTGTQLTVIGNNNSASQSGGKVTITGTGNSVRASDTAITLSGTGETLAVTDLGAGHDTIYANNSTITIYATASILATETVVGTGDTVTRVGERAVHAPLVDTNSSVAGTNVLSASSAATSLIHAMATYSPTLSGELDFDMHPDVYVRETLAANLRLNS